MARPLILLTLLTSATVLGCAATGPRPEVAETPAATADAPDADVADEDKPLPEALESLDLSDAQRRELWALRDDLKRDLAPIMDSGKELVATVASAIRRCRGETPMMSMRASNVIATGEQIRPHALDAINRFHHILTPAQRKALAQRLLDGEDRSRESRNDSPSRGFPPGLGLSLGQIVQMAIRLQTLRGSLEEEIEPWRERYRDALEAFVEDDFDVRRLAIAEVPAVEIIVNAGGDALRLLVPLLEPEQCERIADMIEERMRKSERER